MKVVQVGRLLREKGGDPSAAASGWPRSTRDWARQLHSHAPPPGSQRKLYALSELTHRWCGMNLAGRCLTLNPQRSRAHSCPPFPLSHRPRASSSIYHSYTLASAPLAFEGNIFWCAWKESLLRSNYPAIPAWLEVELEPTSSWIDAEKRIRSIRGSSVPLFGMILLGYSVKSSLEHTVSSRCNPCCSTS